MTLKKIITLNILTIIAIFYLDYIQATEVEFFLINLCFLKILFYTRFARFFTYKPIIDNFVLVLNNCLIYLFFKVVILSSASYSATYFVICISWFRLLLMFILICTLTIFNYIIARRLMFQTSSQIMCLYINGFLYSFISLSMSGVLVLYFISLFGMMCCFAYTSSWWDKSSFDLKKHFEDKILFKVGTYLYDKRELIVFLFLIILIFLLFTWFVSNNFLMNIDETLNFYYYEISFSKNIIEIFNHVDEDLIIL